MDDEIVPNGRSDGLWSRDVAEVRSKQTKGEDAALQTVAGQTQSSMAYYRLRQDIISSTLPAGSRLRIRDLCGKYQLAMSSIREALNRLARDGLVLLEDLRGFSVAPMTRQDLTELTKARCWLNECALRESIALGGDAWEETILVAYHRMSRIPRYGTPDDPTVNPKWDAAHRVFHASLIAACGSSWVLSFCEQLFDAADRYRHLARAAHRDREDDHKQIMDATLSRDVETAVALLNAHFQRTAEFGMPHLAKLSDAAKARPR
jgi:GntR family transcriptional regulator, carbon starvation induced regulator